MLSRNLIINLKRCATISNENCNIELETETVDNPGNGLLVRYLYRVLLLSPTHELLQQTVAPGRSQVDKNCMKMSTPIWFWYYFSYAMKWSEGLLVFNKSRLY